MLPNFLRAWILLSAWLVGAGWILSACRALNRTGYGISFALAAVTAFYWWRKNFKPQSRSPASPGHKFWRRFKRPLPLLFLLIVLLNFLGMLLVHPANGDTNAYRIPRVLHWLWTGGWHWIHTGDSRMNIAGCGYEWLYAPVILFTRTDRWVCIPNLLSFLLLPGLIFSIFQRLRISPRVAWWWMWLLASGWCFVFQGGSTLNDSLGAVYALAAVDLALRARDSGKAGDLWLSLLAAGLMTGMKQTNLPLLLPWLVAVWPATGLLLKRPVLSVAALGFCLLVSAAPMIYLDWKYTGNWSGFPKTVSAAQTLTWGGHQELTSPFWGVVGNVFCLSAQNLLPPFFPKADAWNNAMGHFVQTPFGAHFAQFEVFGHLGRSVSEGTAGIGLGIFLLTLVSILVSVRFRRLPGAGKKAAPDWHLWLLYLAPWAALLVFMAKVGTYQNARQAAPYYVFLFPLILAGSPQAWLTRQRWWRGFALLLMLVTIAYLGFIRTRPLVPAGIVAQLHEKYPHNKIFTVMEDYYISRTSVNAQRNFIGNSPAAAEKTIGFATVCSSTEPGWWLPFGQRCVLRVLPGEKLPELLKAGVHYMVVEDVALKAANQTLEQWATQYHGSLVGQVSFIKDPGAPPGYLYLLHLDE